MEAGNGAVLAVSGLRKSYGDNEVVRGLDFSIARGECFGLLGPNGAGKTTTLRCCLGLIEPNAGTITLVGEPVPKAAREARVRVGVVPQMDNLDPDFTVVENLRVYGRYFGIPDAVLEQRIPQASRSCRARQPGRRQHPDALRRHEAPAYPRASAGQRSGAPHSRRTDDGSRPAGQAPDLGRPAAASHSGQDHSLTTHFMDEAERLCSRLAVIDHGRMIASDTPRALIAAHVEPEVVEVYGDEARAWAETRGKQLADRIELAGETAFCYARDRGAAARGPGDAKRRALSSPPRESRGPVHQADRPRAARLKSCCPKPAALLRSVGNSVGSKATRRFLY